MVGGGAGAHDESHRYRVAQNVKVYDLARTHTHLYILYTERRISRNGRVQWGGLIYFNDAINV